MSRVKRGIRTRARHHKILKAAKGYWGHKSKLFKVANQQVLKSGYQRCLPFERHQLLQIHERPQEGWYRARP